MNYYNNKIFKYPFCFEKRGPMTFQWNHCHVHPNVTPPQLKGVCPVHWLEFGFEQMFHCCLKIYILIKRNIIPWLTMAEEVCSWVLWIKSSIPEESDPDDSAATFVCFAAGVSAGSRDEALSGSAGSGDEALSGSPAGNWGSEHGTSLPSLVAKYVRRFLIAFLSDF